MGRSYTPTEAATNMLKGYGPAKALEKAHMHWCDNLGDLEIAAYWQAVIDALKQIERLRMAAEAKFKATK